MTARRVAIAFAAGSGVLCVIALALIGLSLGASIGEGSWGFRGFGLINAVGFTSIGAIVAIRRPQNLIGRFLLANGVFWALTELEFEYAVYAIVGRPGPLPGGMIAAWLCSWEWTINVGLYPVLFVIFPDGRISSLARRAVVGGSALVTALLAFVFAVRPGPLQLTGFVDNPFTPVPQSMIDAANVGALARSEEHTSELQSPCNLVCRLLLEKNKYRTAHARLPSCITNVTRNRLLRHYRRSKSHPSTLSHHQQTLLVKKHEFG